MLLLLYKVLSYKIYKYDWFLWEGKWEQVSVYGRKDLLEIRYNQPFQFETLKTK